MYYTYILRSEKDGRYYYGSCEDIEKRLSKHNSGQVKATKYRIPFVLHYLKDGILDLKPLSESSSLKV